MPSNLRDSLLTKLSAWGAGVIKTINSQAKLPKSPVKGVGSASKTPELENVALMSGSQPKVLPNQSAATIAGSAVAGADAIPIK